MPCASMNRRSWLPAITSAGGYHAKPDSGVDTFLEGVDEATEDGRDVALCYSDFDDGESALVVRGLERISELARCEGAEPATAPEVGEFRKRPTDGLVVFRVGKKRLEHF